MRTVPPTPADSNRSLRGFAQRASLTRIATLWTAICAAAGRHAPREKIKSPEQNSFYAQGVNPRVAPRRITRSYAHRGKSGGRLLIPPYRTPRPARPVRFVGPEAGPPGGRNKKREINTKIRQFQPTDQQKTRSAPSEGTQRSAAPSAAASPAARRKSASALMPALRSSLPGVCASQVYFATLKRFLQETRRPRL